MHSKQPINHYKQTHTSSVQWWKAVWAASLYAEPCVCSKKGKMVLVEKRVKHQLPWPL